MANNNAPFGARPVRHKSGAPYAGQQNLYYYTGSSNLFIGDPVVVTAGSNTTNYYGSPPGSLPYIALATAGDSVYITGFITGFFAEDFSSKAYGVGSATRGVYVCDDPEMVYEIQDDGVATSTTSFPSANAILTSGTGSTATNLSGWMLGSTTYTSATSQMKILRLSTRSNNAVGQYAVWDVMINLPTLVAGAIGY